MVRDELQQRIRTVSPAGFESLALDIFQSQAQLNPLYAEFLNLLGIMPSKVEHLEDIPCLPIQFFKNHIVKTGNWDTAAVFSSSGTTGATTSRHAVRDLDWYRENATRGFENAYGPVEDHCFLALLPSYLERSGSSLVSMAEHFISRSTFVQSGFFLNNTDILRKVIHDCRDKNIPTVLLGVSFALWDLALEGDLGYPELIVMETGGMKGRRQEITRVELHEILIKVLGVSTIHSEYGMTELLSQAYSKGGGVFKPGPTLRVWARDITDPLSAQKAGKTGALNVVDLANLDTISFIATDDLGKVYEDGTF